MNASLAAIAFPVVILLLIPVRTLLIPRLSFTSEELSILDGPTASPFVSFVSDIAEATADTRCRQWSPSEACFSATYL